MLRLFSLRAIPTARAGEGLRRLNNTSTNVEICLQDSSGLGIIVGRCKSSIRTVEEHSDEPLRRVAQAALITAGRRTRRPTIGSSAHTSKASNPTENRIMA